MLTDFVKITVPSYLFTLTLNELDTIVDRSILISSGSSEFEDAPLYNGGM